jgi:hypothetical protein
MRVGSLLAGVLAGVAVGLIVEENGNAQPGPEVHNDVAATPAVRQRLAQSLATIQSVHEVTRKSGQVQRRHLWQLGEALPWRSTCQPSCRRQHFELKQMPQVWPAATDASSLRALLADKVPGVRALAAEALATLHQPEDVSRLAALLTDGAEATIEVQAPVYGQQSRPFQVGPAPDAVTRHTWRNSSVASHAAWGLYLMFGDCCPQAIVDLVYTDFNAFSPAKSPQPGAIDASIVSSLVAGDAKDHLWYWQEYIHRAVHQLDDAAEDRARGGTPGFSQLDWRRQSKLVSDERQRERQNWMKSFFVQMRSGPAERRAMVRLLACDVHQGGADMAFYDTRDRLLFNGPLELGLKKDRILQLFDGIGLWPREQRLGGGESQVVERLAMAWEECFTADDVPRLLTRFSRHDNWWSARAALVVALSHLMPTSGKASDDAATAEGFLRRTLKEDHDVFIRDRAALELLRMDADVHWPFLKARFFADRDNGDDLPRHILEWFVKAPTGDGPTRKLIELVSDDRFRPLWLEAEVSFGKGVNGGVCRRYAREALNARFGRTMVTDEDIAALQDPKKGPARLSVILARVHDLIKP